MGKQGRSNKERMKEVKIKNILERRKKFPKTSDSSLIVNYWSNSKNQAQIGRSMFI